MANPNIRVTAEGPVKGPEAVALIQTRPEPVSDNYQTLLPIKATIVFFLQEHSDFRSFQARFFPHFGQNLASFLSGHRQPTQ